jgi:hypothetical protein
MIYWSFDTGAQPEAEGSGPVAAVSRVFSVVTHFFTRTRWERLLHQIH